MSGGAKEGGIMHRDLATHLWLGFLVVVLVSGCAWNASAQSMGNQPSPTLYNRLGGYDAVAAVTDEFLGRLISDQIGRAHV